MNVAVVAAAHAETVQKIDDVTAHKVAVNGREVQKNQNLGRRRLFLQGGGRRKPQFQAHRFAPYDLAVIDGADRLLLRHHGTDLTLQRQLKLTQEQTFHFRSIYERIIGLMQSQLPGNIFAAEQLTAGIVAELAANETARNLPEHYQPDLADRLKQALDADREIGVTLQEHCRKLGYSPEYARRCFNRKFNIDPQEYRLRLRLEYIFRLMNMRSYSMKEIADLAGMKNVTHLHSFIRKRCGMTPRELAKKFPF